MIRIILLSVVALALIGCAEIKPDKASSDEMAQCQVCKHNADLGCVDVKVTKDTPQYVYQGKTYYFCSPACRDEFAESPAKFLPR